MSMPGRLSLIAENLQRLRRHAQLVAGDAGRSCDVARRASRSSASWSMHRARRAASFGATRTSSCCGGPRTSRRSRSSSSPSCAAWSAKLAPGGRLVYSTCSVLPEENERVVAALLEAEPSLAAIAPPRRRSRPGRSAARSACSFCPEQRRGPTASIMLVSKRQRPEPEHAAGGPSRPRSIRA